MDRKSFPYTIIYKYYPEENQLRQILLAHSEQVARKALMIADAHPEMKLDRQFLEESALLHDIGIFLCDAPSIQCFGTQPYICHGYLGADLLRKEGYNRHALVCERHTGTGISLKQIEERNLPIPHRDMQPVSMDAEKTVEQARKCLLKFGEDGVVKFDQWCKMFL